MNFREGDRVTFLNEKGKGIVSRWINKNTVAVIIEEGFEIPYLASELINLSDKSIHTKKNSTDTEISSPIISIPYPIFSKVNSPPEGVYIAISPENSKNISNTDFNLRLINHTPYNISYSYSLMQQGKYKTQLVDQLLSGKHTIIDTLKKKSLHDYSSFKMDMLFFKEDQHNYQSPVSELVKLKPVKLYKENTFVENTFIDDRAWILRIVDLQSPIYGDLKNHLNLALEKKTIHNASKNISKPNRNNDPSKEMEIDLHIEELLDEYGNMSNYEIVQIQLNAFQQAINTAIKENYRRLIVIHGIGSGKLKQEVRNLLTASYPKFYFYDASYSKYGQGATEIILP